MVALSEVRRKLQVNSKELTKALNEPSDNALALRVQRGVCRSQLTEELSHVLLVHIPRIVQLLELVQLGSQRRVGRDNLLQGGDELTHELLNLSLVNTVAEDNVERLVRNGGLRSQRSKDVYRLVVRTEESGGALSSQTVLSCSLLVRSLVVVDDDVGTGEVLRHSPLGIGSQTLQTLQGYTPLHLGLTKDFYLGSLLVKQLNSRTLLADRFFVVVQESLLHLV